MEPAKKNNNNNKKKKKKKKKINERGTNKTKAEQKEAKQKRNETKQKKNGSDRFEFLSEKWERLWNVVVGCGEEVIGRAVDYLIWIIVCNGPVSFPAADTLYRHDVRRFKSIGYHSICPYRRYKSICSTIFISLIIAAESGPSSI